MKKVLIGLLVLAMIGGLIAGVLAYWPYESPEGDDPFADVPYPLINSYRYADLSGQDASAADLTKVTDTGTLSFNTSTVWPEADKLPEGFSPEATLSGGRDFGLGIRGLHEQGVTGKGVSLAVIDMPVLEGHEAFPSDFIYNTDLLKDVDSSAVNAAGAYVTSVISGIAPEARVYYFAIPNADNTYVSSTEALDKIIALNETLPDGEKVSVVVASQTLNSYDQTTGVEGAADWIVAMTRAQNAGITVLYPGMNYPDLSGAGVIPGTDKDDPSNYRVWSWTAAKGWAIQKIREAGCTSWAEARAELVRLLTEEPDLDSIQAEAINAHIYLAEVYKSSGNFAEWLATAEGDLSSTLAVPVDCITVATVDATDGYAYFGSGSLSWASAYIAGLISLGRQVNPVASNADLLTALSSTGTPFVTGGKLVSPAGFVDALR